MSPLVCLEKIAFQYPQAPAPVIRDMTFHLTERETVAVVGKSGVGKSTLLRLIGGELTPTSGVSTRGETLRSPGAVAHVDQDSTVFNWMRVSQIVSLCLSRDSRNSNGSKMTVEESLAAFELEGTGDLYPPQLSGGMRQRLALAFALLRHPRMLLLDEPFVSVDDFTKDALYRLLHTRIADTPAGVVLITHNINECLTLSDRVVVLGGAPGASAIATFEVEGPKPRSALMLLEPRFVALNREIRSAIAGDTRRSDPTPPGGPGQ